MNKIKKYTLSKQKKEEIIKMISTDLLQHDEIFAAYIFGSFITGESFADFESYVLKKYFDFARFRRRYLSEVINAPIWPGKNGKARFGV